MCGGWRLVGQDVQVVVGVGGRFTSVPLIVPVLDTSLSQFVYAEQY